MVLLIVVDTPARAGPQGDETRARTGERFAHIASARTRARPPAARGALLPNLRWPAAAAAVVDEDDDEDDVTSPSGPPPAVGNANTAAQPAGRGTPGHAVRRSLPALTEVEPYRLYDRGASPYHTDQTADVPTGHLCLAAQGHERISLVLVGRRYDGPRRDAASEISVLFRETRA